MGFRLKRDGGALPPSGTQTSADLNQADSHARFIWAPRQHHYRMFRGNGAWNLIGEMGQVYEDSLWSWLSSGTQESPTPTFLFCLPEGEVLCLPLRDPITCPAGASCSPLASQTLLGCIPLQLTLISPQPQHAGVGTPCSGPCQAGSLRVEPLCPTPPFLLNTPLLGPALKVPGKLRCHWTEFFPLSLPSKTWEPRQIQ